MHEKYKNIKIYHKIYKDKVRNIFDKRKKGKVFTIPEIDKKLTEC